MHRRYIGYRTTAYSTGTNATRASCGSLVVSRVVSSCDVVRTHLGTHAAREDAVTPLVKSRGTRCATCAIGARLHDFGPEPLLFTPL